MKKTEHQKKGAVKLKIESSLFTLYWGFKNIPFELYTYVLAKILENGATFIEKLTSDFKNNLESFRQAVKSPKS